MAWYIATSAALEQGGAVGVAGAAQQGGAVGVAGLGGDACAGVDHQFESVDAERSGNGGRTRPNEGVNVVHIAANAPDREFVAGEPGEEIAGSVTLVNRWATSMSSRSPEW